MAPPPVAQAALHLADFGPAGPGALLRLPEPAAIGPVRILQLEIDAGTPLQGVPRARWQRRRGSLRRAELQVEQDLLAAWLHGPAAARLRSAGVERLGVRLSPSLCALTAQLALGGRRVWMTARGRLQGAPGGALCLHLDAVRVYGFTPVPSAFGGLHLLQALTRELGPALEVTPPLCEAQAFELRCDALRLLLYLALPPLGQRLPSLRGVALQEVRLREGSALLRYEGPGDSLGAGGAGIGSWRPRAQKLEAPDKLAAGFEPGSLGHADRLLGGGEAEAALALYERLAASESISAAPARLRLMQVLSSMPPRHAEAERLAVAELSRAERSPVALLVLASIEAERGQAERAAARLIALSELPENTPEEVAAAALCVAELLLPQPKTAKDGVRWLERAAAIPGGLPSQRAAERLGEQYSRAGRWESLANLEERQLSMAPPSARPELVRRYLRLGALYLDELEDKERARAAIEQALRLDEESPAAWELRARLFMDTGLGAERAATDLPEVLRSLDRAAALSPPEVGAEIMLRAAALCERAAEQARAAGDGEAAVSAEAHLEQALLRYRQAVAYVPESTQALVAAAELLGQRGRPGEARALWESLLEVAPGGEDGDGLRRRALVALSRIALADPAGRPLARGYIGRAMALGGEGDAAVLLGWADLEHADGHLDQVEKALGRLEDLGVRDHMLRRAESLLELGRAGDAVGAAERTLVLRPDQAPAALRVLLRAHKALGDARGQKDALERLVEIEPEDRRARAELGRVLAAGGDLPAARQQLERAGKDVGTLELLAEVLGRQRDEEALAAALADLAAALAPLAEADASRRQERAATLGRLAELLARRSRRAEAEARLEEALALLGGGLGDEAAAAVGEAALLLGRYQDARRALAPLLAEGRGPQPALVTRSLRLGELGEREHPEEALQDFRRALAAGARGAERMRAHRGVIRLAARVGLIKNPADLGAAQEAQAEALVQAAEDPRTDELGPARAALYVQAGDLRRKQERTQEAIALYERALAADPMHLPALEALEALAEQLGDAQRLAEVLAAKARASASRPAERKQLLGRLGTIYAERLGRRDLARDAFRQALALDPAYYKGLAFLAEDAQQRGDHGAELAHLKRLAGLEDQAGLDPEERAEVHARLAQLHRRAGRHEEAERQALLALRHQPEHAQALHLLDERYTNTGRFAELADVLLRRAAVEMEAVERRDALSRRARVLDEELGDPRAALQAYHDLVRIAPDLAACVRLAQLAAELGAIEEIQDVAPVVGRALLDTGQAQAAIPILSQATGHGAGEPLFALLAEAYEAVGESDRAADAWGAAGRAADPVRHAQALERAGRLEEAMAAWVSMASSEPELGEDARRAAAALARRAMAAQPEDAAAWARRLLEVEPQDAAALARYLESRPPDEVPALLDGLGRRLTREEAAATWLAAAQQLSPSLIETRRELLRRTIDLGPTREAVLLMASLEDGAERHRQSTPPGAPAAPVSFDRSGPAPSRPPSGRAATAGGTGPEALLARAVEEGEGQVELLLGAAARARRTGDLRAARAALLRAGDAEPALHARVELEREAGRLFEAEEGGDDDALPALLLLRERGAATRDELRLLARLHTARGRHAEAARVQREAGADPEDLLAELESAGRYGELLVALSEHAAVAPTEARRLYAHAARVAEQQIGDRHQAAALLEQAAFCQGGREESAALWAQAGALWNSLGERERGAAALGRALTEGGEKTPGVLLALGDYAFDDGDWEGAARHYRRALAVGQVSQADKGRIRMRLAAIERRRGNAGAEEQELAAAVEAGAGAQAWPALAALFRAQGESARLGAALLAWADYEIGPSRLSLLQQAAALVSPSLLPRVDDELTKLDADDEEVRDRVLQRQRQAGDLHGLGQALVRDVDKSEGQRRLIAARELAAVCEQLGDVVAAAAAWRVVLESSDDQRRDAEEALGWLGRLREAGAELPADVLGELRALILKEGQIGQKIAQLDEQLEELPDGPDASPEVDARREALLREAAELCETLGDHEDAARRWLRLCVLRPEVDDDPSGGRPSERPSERIDESRSQRARHELRLLCDEGRAQLALQLVEDELRRVVAPAKPPAGLRVAQAEVLAHLGRGDEAIGHLDLALLRAPDSGPAHALLGLLLLQSPQPAESARGLPHLLLAVSAPDVEPQEAGECALVAAEFLLAGGGKDLEERTARLGHDSSRTPHLLQQLGDPQVLLERAAELLPGDRRPLDGLIRLAVERGQDERAALLLERVLDIAGSEGERARLLVDQAAILVRLGRADDAEAALGEALSLSPQLYEARRALRQLWAARGQGAQAEAQCQRELDAAEDLPARVELLLELGSLREARGDGDGALAAYRTAGQLGALPNAPPVVSIAAGAGWLGVSRILAEREQFLEAADAAGRAAELLDPLSRGPALLQAADLALQAGDEGRARDHLERAAALPPVALEAHHRLLHLDGGDDPAERRQALLARLPEAEGLVRIDLLRRLLLLALETGDDEAARPAAAELFLLNPADDLAFREHHRLLGAGDPAALGDLWLRRAEALADPLARADALCAAAVIADEGQGDLGAAEQRFMAALGAVPDHLSALLGLADLAYRRGDYARALELYNAASDVPPGRPDAAEILRRRAELAEAAEDPDAALLAYQHMLDLGLRERDDAPAGLEGAEARARAEQIVARAAEELTRLYQARGDWAAALSAIQHALPAAAPEDPEGRERLQRLRLHGAWLALQAGRLDEAERPLQELLAQEPQRREALQLLLDLHHQAERPEGAAAVLEQLLAIAQTPEERADLLYERAAIYEAQLGDATRAFELYQQALEALPGHPPSLRRLIVCYLREANGVGAAEAVRELEEAGQPLEDVQCLGGVGLALAGGDEQADRLLRGATPEQLAQALSAVGLPPPGDLSLLDEPIAAAVRALGGTAGLPALEAALHDRLRAAPFGIDVGARQVLGRLCELRGEPHARVHLAVLAFLWPEGYASQRLEVLGPAAPRALATDPMPTTGQGPLRGALAVLGQHLYGLAVAPLPLSADWGLRLRSLGQAAGFAKLDVAVVESLPEGEEPARCDPTRPPRLRLLRRLTADGAQARFGALRALRLLLCGVPLVQGRSPAEVGALLRAAAHHFSAVSGALDPLAESWLAELKSLPFRPESLRGKARSEARAALRACVERLDAEPGYLDIALPAFLEGAARAAERQAYAETGDLLAALRALCPGPQDTPEARLHALQQPALRDLIDFADQPPSG